MTLPLLLCTLVHKQIRHHSNYSSLDWPSCRPRPCSHPPATFVLFSSEVTPMSRFFSVHPMNKSSVGCSEELFGKITGDPYCWSSTNHRSISWENGELTRECGLWNMRWWGKKNQKFHYMKEVMHTLSLAQILVLFFLSYQRRSTYLSNKRLPPLA